jgi:putative ABC transport system permease protein
MYGHDLRQALRALMRQPVLAFTVIATMGIGIGANATVFSAVGGLLGPLPFPNPDRLVQVWQAAPEQGVSQGPVTAAAASAWLERRDLFTGVGAYLYTTSNRTDLQPPERVPVAYVTAGFFDALGVAPVAGRVFTPSETASDLPLVVITESLWRSRLDSRPDIVGQPLRFGPTTYNVIGVMPDRLEHLSWRGTDLWLPLALDATEIRAANYRVVARLRDDVSLERAEQVLDGDAKVRHT